MLTNQFTKRKVTFNCRTPLQLFWTSSEDIANVFTSYRSLWTLANYIELYKCTTYSYIHIYTYTYVYVYLYMLWDPCWPTTATTWHSRQLLCCKVVASLQAVHSTGNRQQAATCHCHLPLPLVGQQATARPGQLAASISECECTRLNSRLGSIDANWQWFIQ